MRDLEVKIEAAMYRMQNATFGIPLVELYVGLEGRLNLGLNGETSRGNTPVLNTIDIESALNEFVSIDVTEPVIPYLIPKDFDIDTQIENYIDEAERLRRWILDNGVSNDIIQSILADWAKEQATIHQALSRSHRNYRQNY